MSDDPSGSAYQAMSNAGLPIEEHSILRGEHSEQAGRDAMARWRQLSAEQRPTAIVAVSDLMAIGVMHEAQRQGLEVGKDVSLIGFDDAPMTEYLRPALTTLQQPIPEVCAALISMLEMMLNKHDLEVMNVLVPPRLIIRESCARLPS